MAFSFPPPAQQQQSSFFQTPSQPQQFQFQPSTPNPFQQQPQQPAFQFQPQQQPSLFQPQQQQLQQQQLVSQQPQHQQQQPIFLYTVDKTPANYNTKWPELHPDSQKYLLMIEERILEYRADSEALEQCSRLYDSSVANYGFEADANRILQELGGISTAMERERASINKIASSSNTMMRETELAVRPFIMLRQRFLHRSIGANAASGSASQTSGATTTAPNTQSLATVPVFDFYSGVPRRPSSFMLNTVSRFEKYLTEYSQWIGELEQMLNLVADRNISDGISSLQSLPSVLENLHDYFLHVAAKVENLHQQVESMKTAYLSDRRRSGDWNDPFLEADRREVAKLEAAAKRVHPTLHLPPPPPEQPAAQSAGLSASSTAAGSTSAPQPSLGTSGTSSASSFSFFGNPSSSAQPSLFATPFSSASTPSLFASAASLTQSTPFAATSTPTLGSSQPSSLFGSATNLFASPGVGSSPAFSTPFASGAATGSGYSFSGATASKPSKPKSRASRR